MKAELLVSVLCAAAIGVPGLAAADSVYDWSFNGGGISASGTVDVLNGFVRSATGTISGGGLPGSEALSLITAGESGTSVPDPAHPVAGSFVFETAGGQVRRGHRVERQWTRSLRPGVCRRYQQGASGAANYGFNPWVNTDGSAQGSLAGANGPEGRIYRSINTARLPSMPCLCLLH